MDTCAKNFRMSASEFKVKIRVTGWIYRSNLMFFFLVLLENNEILVIIHEKTELNETKIYT